MVAGGAQPAGSGARGAGREADDVVAVVDPGRLRRDAGDLDVVVLLRGLVDGVRVGVADAVVVEADGDPGVVDAEELVDLAGHLRRLGVAEGLERAVPLHEAVVVAGVADPETGRVLVGVVVDAGHLRLGGTGVVLVGVVALPVRGNERVPAERMGRAADPVVAGDGALGVDPEELVERRVGLVVEGRERVAGGGVGPRCRGGVGRPTHREQAGAGGDGAEGKGPADAGGLGEAGEAHGGGFPFRSWCGRFLDVAAFEIVWSDRPIGQRQGHCALRGRARTSGERLVLPPRGVRRLYTEGVPSSPMSRAMPAAFTRLDTPSLRRMLETCTP